MRNKHYAAKIACQSAKRGRPSKLDDRSRSEIGRRLALGEKASGLAKEFGLSRSRFSELFSEHGPKIRDVAERLASVEVEVASLPISEQVSVRTLADQLKDLGQSLLKTATLNSQTAEIMAGRARKAASALPDDPTLEDLRLPGAFIEVANKASNLTISLVSKNQETVIPPAKTLEELICEGVEARGDKSLAEDVRKARLRVANGQSPFETIEVVTGIPRPARETEQTA